jgi:hypothetical protein
MSKFKELEPIEAGQDRTAARTATEGILSPEQFAAKKAELLSGLWAECSRC